MHTTTSDNGKEFAEHEAIARALKAGFYFAHPFAAWISHRKIARMLAGLAGPLMILVTLYLFWTDNWSTYMFYLGVFLMLIVAIWDLVAPASGICNIPHSNR
ncbi:MAG: hypothetical protein HY356_08505 [Gammaproteobacteria bacterium]|nr:hypothetical protein [Gammaproteobacteria bacterium]